jgi:flagellar biosynthesis protein
MSRQPRDDVRTVDVVADGAQLVAVALAYRGGAKAPQVTAKGRGAIAEQIIERAREAGIYVHQSRDLVGLLMQVDLDQHIPAQLYLAVAELLAWLYRIEHGLPLGPPQAAAALPAP